MNVCNIRTVIYRHIQVNQKIFQTIRTLHNKRNHYETLKLQPNCTAKDIRDSFVKLSKKNHPDVSTGENTRQNADNFQDVVEAYKILGKPDSRAIYDSVMSQGTGSIQYSYAEPSQSYQNHPTGSAGYYGIFGSKRISNKKVVLYCMIFMVVGVIVQALAIRNSITFRRDKLDRVSKEAGMHLSKTRAHAEEHGNDYQLKMLAQKSTGNN